MATNIKWVTPPTKLGRDLEARVKAVEPAVRVLAQTHAARGESTMKSGAPWTDRTGYARGALYGRSEGTTIYIGTTNEEYGLFLELGTIYMAPRAIIEPTLNEVARDYFSDVIKLVATAMGGGRLG